jgi:hypothetical protein
MIDLNGRILVDCSLFSIKKLLQIKPLFKYNSKVNSESVDILANYVASSFLWFKCYGTLYARGNTKKNPVTKPQKTIKFHKAKIQGHHDETINAKSSAKKMKLDNTEETFFYGL